MAPALAEHPNFSFPRGDGNSQMNANWGTSQFQILSTSQQLSIPKDRSRGDCISEVSEIPSVNNGLCPKTFFPAVGHGGNAMALPMISFIKDKKMEDKIQKQLVSPSTKSISIQQIPRYQYMVYIPKTTHLSNNKPKYNETHCYIHFPKKKLGCEMPQLCITRTDSIRIFTVAQTTMPKMLSPSF